MTESVEKTSVNIKSPNPKFLIIKSPEVSDISISNAKRKRSKFRRTETIVYSPT